MHDGLKSDSFRPEWNVSRFSVFYPHNGTPTNPLPRIRYTQIQYSHLLKMNLLVDFGEDLGILEEVEFLSSISIRERPHISHRVSTAGRKDN